MIVNLPLATIQLLYDLVTDDLQDNIDPRECAMERNTLGILQRALIKGIEENDTKRITKRLERATATVTVVNCAVSTSA